MGNLGNIKYKGKAYSVTASLDSKAKGYVVELDPIDDALTVSYPIVGNEAGAMMAAKRCLPRLYWARINRRSPYQDGYLYLFGEKQYVGTLNEEDLDALMKQSALPYYKEKVAYFENVMGVKDPYKVRVRTMKTRYGVNSKRTHTITLQTQLVCYPQDIINSVIVHELAHHFVFNHSKAFYDVVYRYCPDYKKLVERLKTRKYERETDLSK